MTITSPRPRFAGLDGLRAIAVLLVIVSHLFPQSPLRSGYVGVDVFFVISGFLITSLLIREREDSGRIRLGRFWSRRARRLLPALVLMVTVCATAAWFVGGDVLLDLGRQVLGAATFSSNWIAIAAGGDYFAAGQTDLFRNLWSLAVEEQFYLAWPLLLPLLLRLRPAARSVIVLAAAAASAGWMLSLAASGALTRGYFGTDAHAFGLLIGVALAFGARALLERPAAWMSRRSVHAAVTAIGVVALGALLVVAALPGTSTTAVPEALIATSVLTAIVVAAAVWPGSVFGRALDVAPLRIVGERSYALYLWHWPVLVLIVAAIGGTTTDVPPWAAWTALGVTAVASECSLRYVETPVRRLGFRAVGLRIRAALGRSARARVRVLSAAALSVALVGGTTAAIAAAPEVSSGEAAVEAGLEALEAQSNAAPDPTDAAQTEAATDTPPAPLIPERAPVQGAEITAVGDSVMLASAPALLERFPGIEIDAAVSRSMYAAPGILRDLADTGRLRSHVVLALGTNGEISRDTLEEVRAILGPDRRLVLVNAWAPRSWIEGVNAELASYARSHHGVELADWAGAIAPHLDLLAGDQVHPGHEGGMRFADAVAAALVEVRASEERLTQIVRHLTGPVGTAR